MIRRRCDRRSPGRNGVWEHRQPLVCEGAMVGTWGRVTLEEPDVGCVTWVGQGPNPKTSDCDWLGLPPPILLEPTELVFGGRLGQFSVRCDRSRLALCRSLDGLWIRPGRAVPGFRRWLSFLPVRQAFFVGGFSLASLSFLHP